VGGTSCSGKTALDSMEKFKTRCEKPLITMAIVKEAANPKWRKEANKGEKRVISWRFEGEYHSVNLWPKSKGEGLWRVLRGEGQLEP